MRDFKGGPFFTKQIFLNIVLMGCIVFILFQSFSQKEKIAYVDSAKLINQYKGSEEAKKSFEKKSKEWESNMGALSTEIQNSIKLYEKTLGTKGSQEAADVRKQINYKKQELAQYQKAIQEKAADENSKLMGSVVAQINGFLTRYGKEHNYKMILIANSSGTIAYAKDGLDITNVVLEELNNEYKSENAGSK